MLHGKWYHDACGTAFGLELLGERWSMLIVRELLLGGRRFSDIRASMPGISAKVLTERLTALEAAGVLTRRQISEPVPAQIYELTEWGYRAEPAIMELGRWAAMSQRHDPGLPLSAVSLMISLRVMGDLTRMADDGASIGFDIAGQQFIVTLTCDDLKVVRGSTGPAQAVFRAPSAPVLARLFYGKEDPDRLAASDGLEITGDRALAMRFADLFELPPRIG